ncbi:STAS domain-containing protein [Kitasatospora sp. NPDC085464]|uniref:STAS domain-containing protein n=1 Tax=Kitasatospora sp. NPDC085464 TaxID=3364063 RepID=UPI0037C5D237
MTTATGTTPGTTPGPTPAATVLTCDLGALSAPDLAVVDALARLRLAAARHGVGVVLLNASGQLRELLAFSGLTALLPDAADPLGPTDPLDPDGLRDPAGLLGVALLGVQPGRHAEQREEHVGVQEVGEPGDPAP